MLFAAEDCISISTLGTEIRTFPRQVQGLALSLFQLEFSPLKVPLLQHHTVGASLVSTSAHLPWIFELSNIASSLCLHFAPQTPSEHRV